MDTKLLDEIVNSEHLNDCWDECKNESFSSKIEVLIDCRRIILTCYVEIMAEYRTLSYVRRINRNLFNFGWELPKE